MAALRFGFLVPGQDKTAITAIPMLNILFQKPNEYL